MPAAHYTLLKLAFSSDFEDADALLTSFAHGLRCGEAPGGRWHLALCLRALGVEVAQASLTRLGAAFVEDLCGRGLWHWALLVIAATHDDAETRSILARDVLERHAWPPDAAETPGAQLRPGAVEERKRLEEAYELRRAFCGAALQAPDEWLESALATRAGAAGGGGAAHVSHLVGARRRAEAERVLETPLPGSARRGPARGAAARARGVRGRVRRGRQGRGVARRRGVVPGLRALPGGPRGGHGRFGRRRAARRAHARRARFTCKSAAVARRRLRGARRRSGGLRDAPRPTRCCSRAARRSVRSSTTRRGSSTTRRACARRRPTPSTTCRCRRPTRTANRTSASSSPTRSSPVSNTNTSSSTRLRRCAVVVVLLLCLCETSGIDTYVRQYFFRRGVEGTRARTRCSG